MATATSPLLIRKHRSARLEARQQLERVVALNGALIGRREGAPRAASRRESTQYRDRDNRPTVDSCRRSQSVRLLRDRRGKPSLPYGERAQFAQARYTDSAI
jgi:hypothetical protein